jgi:hypothetical protein
MAEKLDDLLARAVPKIAAGGKLASFKRKIARFAARAWVKGPERLAALGAKVSSKTHAAALEAAKASEDDDEGAFLDDVRKALRDDEAFLGVVKALGKAYAAAAAKKAEAEAEPVKRSAKVVVEELAVEEVAVEEAAVEEVSRKKSSRKVEEKEGSSEELPTLEVPDDDDEPPSKPVRMDDDEKPPSRKQKGEFKRVEIEDPGEIEVLAPVVPTAGTAAPVAAAPAEDADDGPDAAAARSIERYKKDGEADELANARKLYKLAVEKAPAGPARAAARAGYALTSLLAGDNDAAAKNAEKALQEDPLCALAISVAARAKRGEGSREKLKAAIARTRSAFKANDAARAGKEADALTEEFPEEPMGKLVRIALAADAREDVSDLVAEAWKVYPSSHYPDLALGEPLDARVSRAAAAWGAAEVERGGTDALILTQRKLDEKENILAGAFQIALGVARTAIATRTDISRGEEQELRTACGEGLLGLQYFDAAAATFDKAFSIDRNTGVAMEAKKGTERSQVMRRAFDKPGVKAKMGSFDGVGTAALKKLVGARVAQAMTEKDAEEGALLKEEVEAVKELIANLDRRSRIEQRARKGQIDNPLAPLAAVEEQVKDLESQKQALGAKETEKKGFFGRALDKVKDTAKGAKLAVQKNLVEGKIGEAHKAVARNLRQAPTGGWGDPVFDKLAKRGSAVDAKLEHLEDELLQAKKIVAKIGEL